LKNDNHVNPSYPLDARLFFSSAPRRPYYYGNSRRRQANGVLLCAPQRQFLLLFGCMMNQSELFFLEQNMCFQERYLVPVRGHVLTPSAFLWKI
jgi:hypothetical protein